MEKESLGFSLEKTISSITWLIQDYSDEIKNWVYVILFASLISSNAFALEEIPRLENTWNIAENLNNPANLTLWKKWSDAHKYSIWYYCICILCHKIMIITPAQLIIILNIIRHGLLLVGFYKGYYE